MTVSVRPTGEHAILALDPGRTTGVFAGYVTLDLGSVKETLHTIRRRKAIEIKGDWREQGIILSSIMNRFVFTANVEQGLSLENIHVVWEDFVLRKGQDGTNTDLTSIWVMAGALMAYTTITENVDSLMPVDEQIDISYQQASEAKGHVKNDRLKLWGLWEIGSEHKRDAARHFALRVDKLLLGK